MTLVSTYEVPVGGVTTVTFSSVPQTATDLVLVGNARTSNTNASMAFNLNSTTAANVIEISATGSVIATSSATSSIRARNISTDTASTFSNFSLYISNYTGTTNKIMLLDAVSETNAATALVTLTSIRTNITSAVTSLTIADANTGTLQQYSSFSLYTITKGTGGATIA